MGRVIKDYLYCKVTAAIFKSMTILYTVVCFVYGLYFSMRKCSPYLQCHMTSAHAFILSLDVK